jgi:hypothetical protein
MRYGEISLTSAVVVGVVSDAAIPHNSTGSGLLGAVAISGITFNFRLLFLPSTPGNSLYSRKLPDKQDRHG